MTLVHLIQARVIMTKRKQPIFNLDPEEQELSDSVDRDEWKSISNLAEEKAKARKAAAHYLRKEDKSTIILCK